MHSTLLMLAALYCAQSRADDWTCPNPKDDFCDAYYAEHLANQADKRLNEVYKRLLSEYPAMATKEEIEATKTAQRAWIKYSDAHCAAVLSKLNGANFTMAENEHRCRLDMLNKRIKELESYCETCRQPVLDTSSTQPTVKRVP
jgi:uncharacterized protein YecT (DUF1311 family)